MAHDQLLSDLFHLWRKTLIVNCHHFGSELVHRLMMLNRERAVKGLEQERARSRSAAPADLFGVEGRDALPTRARGQTQG